MCIWSIRSIRKQKKRAHEVARVKPHPTPCWQHQGQRSQRRSQAGPPARGGRAGRPDRFLTASGSRTQSALTLDDDNSRGARC
eukprot:1542674-Prymnesium_polylepis.1